MAFSLQRTGNPPHQEVAYLIQIQLGLKQIMDITAHWVKCKGNVWCPFDRLNLSNVTELGVYIIWSEACLLSQEENQTVYVGQGNIAERISDHRKDSRITRHKNLYVTWAKVSEPYRSGVERYLADVLQPVEGDQHPQVFPNPVNLPKF